MGMSYSQELSLQRGHAGLAITDTGIGIPEGMGVFENLPNHQARRHGLGLPLVSQIVSAHPRQVDYSSEPGKQHSAHHYL
jgi:nitrogen-specific signal transduction histidine kinase